MSNSVLTNNLGFPRIGAKRELKKATEAYWSNKIDSNELLETASSLRKLNWNTQKKAGINLIPSNDFSFYDQVLDMTCTLGAIPSRFNWDQNNIDLDLMFTIARGLSKIGTSNDKATYASEMTKWFDTNYHYIVPELTSNMDFKLASTKIFDEFQEALSEGIKTKPVLVGPVTYLKMGKVFGDDAATFNRYSLLDKMLPVYIQILQKLEEMGAEWVQIDEPIFSLDLTKEELEALTKTYKVLAGSVNKLKLMVANYFGEIRENLAVFLSLPVSALHVDAVRGKKEIDTVIESFPENKILSIGIVNGRNIWKNNYNTSLSVLEKAKSALGVDNIMVAPSCSMIHSPVTIANESKLDAELLNWMSFATEKLDEIVTLAKATSGENVQEKLKLNKAANDSRNSSTRIHNKAVKERCAKVSKADLERSSEFEKRRQIQQSSLNLPAFPTTTIGSFPQTPEIRKMRAQLRKNEITQKEYDEFIKTEIQDTIKKQEDLDIDVLVHGEFERNDMVEYFGEQLDGFVFSQFGWVQSFGSRYVKPPIIFGDVSRPAPMTVEWTEYSQSLTDKPVKGMLTGPVTILQWSFVRDDQPRSETTKQIALALRDEVVDLEKAGIKVIQIDEPAIREGLPLRQSDWPEYLEWAVDNFKLSASGVQDETQIHTHMCYSEFNDMIESIAALDADVISIESSRSKMDLLDAFVDFKYPNEIGPGVYDIHSPRIPNVDEMEDLLVKAQNYIPKEHIWVNPDCGLKTRRWEEVMPALSNMVEAAKRLRK